MQVKANLCIGSDYLRAQWCDRPKDAGENLLEGAPGVILIQLSTIT